MKYLLIWWGLCSALLPPIVEAGINATVTGFSPTSGAPGTQVTIYGFDLTPFSAVYFSPDASASATIVRYTSSSIVVVVPPNAVSSPITVISDFPAVSPGIFYVAPTVSTFTPRSGIAGTQVTIRGSGFDDPVQSTSVFFNGVRATQGGVNSETQITAFVPAGATTGTITVTNTAGTATSAGYFYLNPVVTGFTPKAMTGQAIDIFGTSLLGVTGVSLSGKSIDFYVISGTNLQAVIPTNAVDGPFLVSSPGGAFLTSSNFHVLPMITGFSPAGGSAGTVVDIRGTGLLNTTRVMFGSIPSLLFTNVNSWSVTAVAPDRVQTAPITVTTGNGTNTSVAPYFAPPVIDSLSPASGPPGISITLQGINFQGATQVSLGGIALAQFQIVSGNRIVVTAPTNIVSGTFEVVTPGGIAVSSTTFSVLGPQPTIDGFTPTSGIAGTMVAVVGRNLSGATSVQFGTVPATFVVQGSGLVVTVPPTAVTGPLTVVTPSGSVTSSASFIVGSTADLRLSISPSLNPAISYAALVLNFQVGNLGPLVASNVQVAVTIPSSLTFIAATGTPDFDHIGNQVVYRFGQLRNGDTVGGSLEVEVGGPTNLMVSAIATSSTALPAGAGNQASAILSAVLPKLVLDVIDPLTFLLRWPSPATNYVLEGTPVPLNSHWATVTNPPIDDGVNRQLTLAPLGDGWFYRLRYSGAP